MAAIHAGSILLSFDHVGSIVSVGFPRESEPREGMKSKVLVFADANTLGYSRSPLRSINTTRRTGVSQHRDTLGDRPWVDSWRVRMTHWRTREAVSRDYGSRAKYQGFPSNTTIARRRRRRRHPSSSHCAVFFVVSSVSQKRRRRRLALSRMAPGRSLSLSVSLLRRFFCQVPGSPFPPPSLFPPCSRARISQRGIDE